MNLWALGFSEDMSDPMKINQAIKYIMKKAECTSRFRNSISETYGNLETSHRNFINLNTSVSSWKLHFKLGNQRINLATK